MQDLRSRDFLLRKNIQRGEKDWMERWISGNLLHLKIQSQTSKQDSTIKSLNQKQRSYLDRKVV